jgi:DNA-binding protein YbaB
VTDPDQALTALDRALAEYPRRVAELTDRLSAAAAATVSGTDEGGLVTVTASGAGEIQSVRVSLRALRDLDAGTLANRLADAANEALTRAEEGLAEATGAAATPDPEVADRLAAFERRMDGLLERLDRVDRDLYRQL